MGVRGFRLILNEHIRCYPYLPQLYSNPVISLHFHLNINQPHSIWDGRPTSCVWRRFPNSSSALMARAVIRPPHSRLKVAITSSATLFAMNQVFYIEELVRRIAFNAEDGSPGSASLLALACCCKILEDPVMDVLWQRQKHLLIILQTLPADCWTITDRVYVSGMICQFSRPLILPCSSL